MQNYNPSLVFIVRIISSSGPLTFYGMTILVLKLFFFFVAPREYSRRLTSPPVEISAAVAKAISPYVDGFYLMTPFGRTALMARIMDRIRSDGLA